MNPTLQELIEIYLKDLELLMNENIEATTTNPGFQQDDQFPGAFLEEKSPVQDIYEYEDILNEEGNAPNNTAIEISTPTGSDITSGPGPGTGY